MIVPVREIWKAIVLSAGLAAGASQAFADTYILDRQHTEIRFTWDHLGLSRQGGRFQDVTGRVSFDPQSPEMSEIDVSIPVASLSTGVAKLDEHLIKSREFFDVGAYPQIVFKSTAIKMKSDRTGEATGDLTINGITRPVVLEFLWNFIGNHPLASINPVYAGHYSAGFSASTQIRRSDWGITRTIPYVSDEIRISIETEMHREGGPPETAAEPGAGEPLPRPEETAAEPALAP